MFEKGTVGIAKRNKPQHPIYVIDEVASKAGKAKPSLIENPFDLYLG